jgi:O-methyltransferase
MPKRHVLLYHWIDKLIRRFGYTLVQRSSSGARIARLVSSLLQPWGYTLAHRSPRWGPFPYECIPILVRYAPWHADPVFLAAYAAIAEATFVDIYRCHTLWTLVEQAAKLPGHLIEIGVWRGGSGALIAQKAALCGIQETVYLCDTFAGIVKAGQSDPVFHNGDLANTSQSHVESLLYERLRLRNVSILPGIFPDQTAHVLEDKQFRFCHIDVDVYHSAKDIAEWIWGRMVVGGLIVYDDYGSIGCAGITTWIEEQANLPDRIVLYNLNGQAIVLKIQ